MHYIFVHDNIIFVFEKFLELFYTHPYNTLLLLLLLYDAVRERIISP
jgi:hypothetical protein